MKFLGKILEAIKMSMKISLAYVSYAWASTVVNIVGVAAMYFIWMAVYGNKTAMYGIDKSQMITYIILSRVLISQFQGVLNITISDSVKNGQIAMDMLRPIDYQLYQYVFRVGDFLLFGLFNGLPLLIISVLMFGISLPHTPLLGALFVVSFIMAFSISFMIEYCLGIASFYTASAWGLQHMKEAVVGFFSGALIPIVFFPGWLRSIAEFLPFKDIVYTPVSIYLGLVPFEGLGITLLKQFMWVIVFLIFSRLFFNIAVKKVTVQGG